MSAEEETAALRAEVAALQREVAEANARLDYVTRGLPVGILETDGDGVVVTANDALKSIAGRDPVAEGVRSYSMIHDDDHLHVAEVYLTSLEVAPRDDWTIDFRVVRPDGTVRWVRSIGRNHFTDDGELRGVLSNWLDVTDEVMAKSSVDRVGAMLDAIPDPVVIVDEHMAIVYRNPAALRLLPPDHAAPGSLVAAHEETMRTMLEVAVPAARRDGHWTGELTGVDVDGTLVPLLVSCSVQRDPTTDVEYVSTISRDISALKRAEAVLRNEARRDVLTDLPNRRALFRALHEALAIAEDTGSLLVTLFVDLDDFKPVNDAHGHDIGDEVLIELAGRIVTATREEDLVARFGGDEFVVLCPGLDQADDAEAVAARIIEEIARPVEVSRDPDVAAVVVGASVGIAEATPGMTADDILRAADRAVYRAKAAGRGRWSR